MMDKQCKYSLQSKLIAAFLLLFIVSQPSLAQFDLPKTDIWLLTLSKDATSGYELKPNHQPKQLTHYYGYNNQPSFSHDGRFLYFTRGDESGYTDIFRLDLHQANHRPKAVTNTPLSEFSGQVHLWNEQEHLFMVQVQTNGEQWLMAKNLTSDEYTRINAATAVGYYALVNNGALQFIVDDPVKAEFWPYIDSKSTPSAEPSHVTEPTLDAEPLLVAEKIGRGMISFKPANLPHRSAQPPLPEQSSLILLTLLKAANVELYQWDPSSHSLEFLTTMPEQQQDFAIDAAGDIWVGIHSKLYRWQRSHQRWQLMADLQADGISQITRLTIHDGLLSFVNSQQD